MQFLRVGQNDKSIKTRIETTISLKITVALGIEVILIPDFISWCYEAIAIAIAYAIGP